jgi:hypothetical protein
MRRIKQIALLTVVLTGSVTPQNVLGQLPWESGSLPGPNAPPGVSLLFLDYGLDPNSGYGAAFAWRVPMDDRLLGLHASAARGLGNRLNYAGGVDLSGELFARDRQTPVAVNWFSGIGASYGEYLELALPFGLAFGRSFEGGALSVRPYASARAILEGRIGSAAPAERSIGFAIDVGSAIAFGKTRRYGLALAASLGDRPAAAIGLRLNGTAVRETSAARATR